MVPLTPASQGWMDKGAWISPSPIPEGQHKGSGALADGGLPSSVAKAGLEASSQTHSL